MISGIHTTLAISPFHIDFNTFTFTMQDMTNHQQQQQSPDNIQSVFLRFTNTDAGIGPIVATLNKTNNNDDSSTYSVTGGYLS
jgi:hypothetical protein